MSDALKALCKREGGYAVVADEIGANDQTIYQIINRIKLPSGEPRGVGPGLQRRLTARYPDWASLSASGRHDVNPLARKLGAMLDTITDPDRQRDVYAALLDKIAELLSTPDAPQAPEPDPAPTQQQRRGSETRRE